MPVNNNQKYGYASPETERYQYRSHACRYFVLPRIGATTGVCIAGVARSALIIGALPWW
jgi:hypothetical protein